MKPSSPPTNSPSNRTVAYWREAALLAGIALLVTGIVWSWTGDSNHDFHAEPRSHELRGDQSEAVVWEAVAGLAPASADALRAAILEWHSRQSPESLLALAAASDDEDARVCAYALLAASRNADDWNALRGAISARTGHEILPCLLLAPATEAVAVYADILKDESGALPDLAVDCLRGYPGWNEAAMRATDVVDAAREFQRRLRGMESPSLPMILASRDRGHDTAAFDGWHVLQRVQEIADASRLSLADALAAEAFEKLLTGDIAAAGPLIARRHDEFSLDELTWLLRMALLSSPADRARLAAEGAAALPASALLRIAAETGQSDWVARRRELAVLLRTDPALPARRSLFANVVRQRLRDAPRDRKDPFGAWLPGVLLSSRERASWADADSESPEECMLLWVMAWENGAPLPELQRLAMHGMRLDADNAAWYWCAVYTTEMAAPEHAGWLAAACRAPRCELYESSILERMSRAYGVTGLPDAMLAWSARRALRHAVHQAWSGWMARQGSGIGAGESGEAVWHPLITVYRRLGDLAPSLEHRRKLTEWWLGCLGRASLPDALRDEPEQARADLELLDLLIREAARDAAVKIPDPAIQEAWYRGQSGDVIGDALRIAAIPVEEARR